MDRTRSLHGAALFVLACMPACGGRSDLFAPEAQDCRQLPGVWSKRVGSEGGESRAADVVLHDGRVVVAGFQMDPPLVPGAPSATLMSYEERSGKLSWSKRFGTKAGVAAFVVTSSGDIVVVGEFSGDLDLGGGPLPGAPDIQNLFLASFDDAGHHLWSKSFPLDPYGTVGVLGGGVRLAVDRHDDLVLALNIAAPVDFGGGPLVGTGVPVAKLDAGGQHIWSKRIGSIAYPNTGVSDLKMDADGNIIITNVCQTTCSVGGDPFTGEDILVVAKLDPGGHHVWSHGFPDIENGFLGVDPIAGDVVVVTALLYDSVDFGGGPLPPVDGGAIVKFDAGGKHVWSQNHPGLIPRIVVTEQREIVAFDGFTLFTLSPDGAADLSTTFPTKNDSKLEPLDVSPAGIASDACRVALSGDFVGSIDFGDGFLESQGYSDGFTAIVSVGP